MANDIDTLVSMGFSLPKVLLAHPEVSDEPEEEIPPQTLGSASSSSSSTTTTTNNDEGEIKDGEQTAQSLICNDCQKLFRDATGAELHATRTGHQNFSESTEAIKPLTEEEKKQKLAELKARMAEKRAARERQEIEERKQAEKIRRKAGQEITSAKEALEAKEMQRALEKKKREKEEERLARAKIKAQIEQDKKERAAKREAAKRAQQAQAEEDAAADAAARASVKKEYTEARLQVRVPGSGPITHTFNVNATLSDVFTFLQTQGCHPPFSLSTTFPRKTYTFEDQQKTLKELNLVPSAALILAYTQ
ncbi:ubiquitin-related domain-containing protein [Cokeromyces recurvatus]|uniref:ubiquitin-related domain-containing protein n=1 Tax=Cokeromyces recurvatus TaxID=90255 RepID=UPI002221219F|nr:ubiquitin-related domain-containing protein [Cokeromyces recurvatus]KAI7905533.1 ubiquitin-related domain-containing protein [Cokeromyces recurvatus]